MNMNAQQSNTNSNPSIIKFLNMLVDYLTQGIIPNIYCKNTQLMQEMFIGLQMNTMYLNYLLSEFKKRNSRYALRSMTANEISNLKVRVKGEAEYLCLCDNYSHLSFYVGPYDYPIKMIT